MKNKNNYYLIILTLLFLTLLAIGLYIFSAPYRVERAKLYVESYLKHFKIISDKHTLKPLSPLQLRGKIITDDNVTIVDSEYIYKLVYSSKVYKDEKITEILEKINEVVPINIRGAKHRYYREPKVHYKQLIFGLTKNDLSKVKQILRESNATKGFTFILSGERRVYPYGAALVPIIGVTRKVIDPKTNYTYLRGINGLEGYHNDTLQNNPLVQGKELHLYINFAMQKELEKSVDRLQKLYSAKEVTALIFDKDNFHIKAFASSNRYNPTHIKQEDIPKLSIKAIHYLFDIKNFKPILEQSGALRLNKPTGIDLSYERADANKTTFVGLFQAFLPIYSDGFSTPLKIAKTSKIKKQQLLSKEKAEQLVKKADLLFKSMPGVPVTLEFKDRNVTSNIYIKPVTKDAHHYLYGYFFIEPKQNKEQTK